MKIEEMTEEQILKAVARGIPDYLSSLARVRDFVPADCVRAQVAELKGLFRESRGLGRWGTLSGRDIQELDALTAHFEAGMHEQARAAQERYLREQTLWKINGNAALALLHPAFAAAGLGVEITLQRYRAKIKVDLGGRYAHFYAGFKALSRAGRAEELARAALDLKGVLDRIGGDIKVCKR